MNIWEINNFKLFLLFFIPGFISLKIYKLIRASDKLDFSKSFFDAIAYSCINFAFFFWIIVLIHEDNFEIKYQYLYFIIMGVLLFITPILWPVFFVLLTRLPLIKKHIINPFKTPWDYFFAKKEPSWIIVKLKNGEFIGGVYSINSYASAYPIEEQIYLEELWDIDSNGKFIRRQNRTTGILILGREIEYLKFYN